MYLFLFHPQMLHDFVDPYAIVGAVWLSWQTSCCLVELTIKPSGSVCSTCGSHDLCSVLCIRMLHTNADPMCVSCMQSSFPQILHVAVTEAVCSTHRLCTMCIRCIERTDNMKLLHFKLVYSLSSSHLPLHVSPCYRPLIGQHKQVSQQILSLSLFCWAIATWSLCKCWLIDVGPLDDAMNEQKQKQIQIKDYL